MSEKQTEEALPMFNRDEIATEAGFFDVMFRLHDIKRECVMPAKVEKYDRSTRLATIKPLVQKFKTTQDGKVFWDRDSYEEIPVVSPFHGGFTIDFPVNEGDQGYLIAIDRPWDEIFDTIQEKGKEWDGKPSKPDDESLATFEQGVFIPSNYGRILIDDEDKGNLVIARVDKDGNVDGRIAVGDRFVDIDMDTTVHGSLTIKDDKRDRKAVVDAKDLGDTDAKFREVTVVTGFKEKVGKIVKLFAKKFRVLADEQIDGEDVEFEVGGGGGGGAKLKLKYGDNAPVVYDGEEEKEFFVPTPPESIVPGDGKLMVRFGTDVATEKFSANQQSDSTLQLAKVADTGNYNDLNDKPTIPTIPAIEIDTTAITSGKAVGGLSVDETDNHKIIASAIDIPAEQIQSDWNATSGKAQILNKPTALKNPNALTIKKSGSADVVYDGSAAKTITLEDGGAKLDHSFSWEGEKKADIAASTDIAVDSKTIQGRGGITVSEKNRVITIDGRGSQVAGYTTPAITYDYEVTGQEWDSTNHRIVIHKVKKKYENGLLKTREAIADEYIQFVEETV